MTVCQVCTLFVVFLLFLPLPRHVFGIPGMKKGSCVTEPSLGLEDGRISDSQLSASSYSTLPVDHFKHQDMKPKYGRLNNKFAWCSDDPDNSWLKVDLGHNTIVTAIATQGYKNIYNHYYVEKYKVQYSLDGSNWKYIKENSSTKTFVGNFHAYDTIRNEFDTIQARYIKVIPVEYKYRVCLRVELYGCGNGTNHTAAPLPTTKRPLTTNASTPTKLPISTTAVTSTPISSESSTQYKHSENATNSAQQKSPSEMNHTRLDELVIGCAIFGGLVGLIIVPLIVFLLLRRRIRKKRRAVQQCEGCNLTNAECLYLDDKAPCIENYNMCSIAADW